jgi:hypothetical protein
MSLSLTILNLVNSAATIGSYPMGIREELAIDVQKLRC